MPYEVRAALKQIAAIEQTSMAGIVQQALQDKVAQYQGRLAPMSREPASARRE